MNRFSRPEISGEAFLRNGGKWGLFPLHFKSIYKILECEYKNVDRETIESKKATRKGRFECFHNGIILIVNCFQTANISN